MSIVIASVFALSAMILPTALVFGVTMPFIGTLVRYWGNYTPREGGVRLEDGSGSAASSASVGYFGMMKRVHRLEGWAGLYKGIVPSILTTLITAVAVSPVVALLAAGHRTLPDGRIYIPLGEGWVSNVLSYALSVLPTLALIPMQIIINRAITTPLTLSSFAPRAALAALLTPTELASPLRRLYTAPGVALSVLLPAVLIPTLHLAWQLTAPNLPRALWNFPILLVGFPMCLTATALLTPLHIAQVRLMLQRQGADAVASVIPAAGQEEVVRVRGDEDGAPYDGLLDCLKCVAREEGWRTLYRAWWVTFLGLALPMVLASIRIVEF